MLAKFGFVPLGHLEDRAGMSDQIGHKGAIAGRRMIHFVTMRELTSGCDDWGCTRNTPLNSPIAQ